MFQLLPAENYFLLEGNIFKLTTYVDGAQNANHLRQRDGTQKTNRRRQLDGVQSQN